MFQIVNKTICPPFSTTSLPHPVWMTHTALLNSNGPRCLRSAALASWWLQWCPEQLRCPHSTNRGFVKRRTGVSHCVEPCNGSYFSESKSLQGNSPCSAALPSSASCKVFGLAFAFCMEQSYPGFLPACFQPPPTVFSEALPGLPCLTWTPSPVSPS